MKIVIDATAALSGGKVYLDHLLPQLARLAQGGEFIVFHANENDDTLANLPVSKAQFRFLRVSGLSASNRVWIGKAILKLVWRSLVFPLHLWRLQADLLFSNAGVAPRWLPRRTRVILALHNSMPLRVELIDEERSTLHRWRLRLLRRLMQRAVRRADATIVFSHDTKARLVREFAAAPDKLAVVHHGIDWGARERALPLDETVLQRAGVTQPYLLFVSQFHRYKNLARLVEAFAQVHLKHPDLSLVLVGDQADKAYWQEVETRIAALGLGERVKQVHAFQRTELVHLYRGALAFVHPSLAETCSFPLLEALALGVPVAAAELSALPEIAGNAACYFDPYDVSAMAASLCHLIKDEALRAALRQQASERATQFTWEKSAQQTLDVIKQVMR